MSVNAFLAGLREQTLELRDRVRDWAALPDELLTVPPAPGSWSVIQCLDHLNGYGDFYLPHLERALQHLDRRPIPGFRSGWLGAYFANAMEPDSAGKPKSKMKAFAKHVPAPQPDARKVLRTFLEQQDTLLRLMERGAAANLNRRVVPLSIAAWLRLKTGDVFRFLIAHNRRHLAQAGRALAAACPAVPASRHAAI